MSTSTEGVPIPPWDLADRLRKALRVADIGVQEMADYLEVSRNTVSAWINGRTPPGTQSIRLWALRTGMPYEWLKNGSEPEDGPPGGGQHGPPDDPESHLRGSNSGPSHYRSSGLASIVPLPQRRKLPSELRPTG